MTRSTPNFPDEATLDRQWDDLVRGNSASETEPTLRALHDQMRAKGPSHQFVSQLRSLIEVAAEEQTGNRSEPSNQFDPGVTGAAATERSSWHAPVPVQSRHVRMRGLSRAGKAASILLAASLVIAIAGAMIRYPFGDSDGTGAPTADPDRTAIAAISSPVVPVLDRGASSADPGRTNVQPGPGPSGNPEIVGQADISGSAMALSGNTIVIVRGSTISALDARSLASVWSVDLVPGLYTTPVIAGDAVYFGYTEKKVGITEYTLGPDHNNQLVSLSMADGSEKWRIDGAGTFPYEPVVVNGTVYTVGSNGDAYLMRALHGRDGRELWAAEPFPNREFPGNSYLREGPITT